MTMNPDPQPQTSLIPSRNPLARCGAAMAAMVHRLCADRAGNIIMMTGLAIIPLTFTIGFGLDYARAERLQTKLNAAADAAALVAVDPSMILQSDTTAKAAAQAMFNAQSTALPGLTNLQSTVNVVPVPNTSLGTLRKVTVSYTANSVNMFSSILHVPTLPIGGSTTANAQQPPNVNFFIAMDVSPSMLLPATAVGLTNEASATAAHANTPNGCAFACHEMIPHNDNIYINDTAGKQVLLSTGYYGNGSTASVYYRYDTGTSTLYKNTGTAMNGSTSNTVVGTPTSSSSSNTSSSKSGNVTTTTVTQTTTTNVPSTTTTVATTYSIIDSTNGPVTIKQNVATTTQTSTASTPVTTTTVTKSNQGGSSVSSSTGSTTTTTGNPSTTTTSATYDTGYWADGYWLTHNYGQIYGSPASLTLRSDDEVAATQQLIPYALNQATTYKVTYQMQMFSFDWTHPGATAGPLVTLSPMTNVNAMGNVNVASLMPATDYWWQNSAPTSSTNINDQGTEMGNMLSRMTAVMPAPGNGSATSTPQEILFIVTDGMGDQDEGSGRVHAPLTDADLLQCTAIKNKGIKIAILYTQYLPQALIGDSWSLSNVAPYLTGTDQDLTALQNCASPGASGAPLVQTVTTDGDFTAALQQLFSTALQTARLVQ